jgi:hypothetical protein
MVCGKAAHSDTRTHLTPASVKKEAFPVENKADHSSLAWLKDT